MKFVKITKENLIFATQQQLKIFNNGKDCAILHYLSSLVANKEYFLVYQGDEFVGVTGWYEDEFSMEENVAWLGWYGVVPELRRHGLGHEILRETIEYVKEKGYKTLRLYTDLDNLEAHKIYDHFFDIKEKYVEKSGAQSVGCYIYTKSLNGAAPKMFEGKFMNLTWREKESKEGMRIFETYKKMHNNT